MHETPKQLTPQVYAKFLEGVTEGLPIKIASARAGVKPNTMNSWLQKGQEDSDEYDLLLESALEHQRVEKSGLQRLFEGTMQAAAEYVLKRYKLINKEAEAGSLSAIVYPLEKMYPEIFGKKVIQEHTGTIERNVNISLDVPQEHKSKVIDLMLKRKSEDKLLGSGS